MVSLSLRSEDRSDRHFAELSIVALTRAVEIEAGLLPVGASGVVVGIYADGKGYEVEFQKPFHAVVTLDVADLSA
ncbi:hypothetical protein GCM10011529_17190 [Polymorphobacter glacialis]|uniref:DUF4926 domain-containing protein n=1 Tax=Sandarakinorhabdus glacialis TaxID=1614636 RepID=A0A916ZSA4_9SPHN|nr:DUF4926 domain-containing protein [Polymorphobacter glacialis]GGE11447.1 hypothetical protein GCM10011529_17190 [Polymorphobacter glacialis]